MRFALCFFVASCATIPGTDVPIPAAEHEGWMQAACVPVTTERKDACCYYYSRGSVLTVCTRDGGDTWDIVDTEDVAASSDESV